MPLVKIANGEDPPESEAPESDAPDSDDERDLRADVRELRADVREIKKDLRRVVASVPTAWEKRAVIGLFTVVAGAVAKHYGIDLP